MSWRSREGPGRRWSPMTILWACDLSVEAYAAAGKKVAVPRPRCPACGRWMIFWSGYGRWVRAGPVLRIWVRRARCPACGGRHGLLPSFCLLGRLDAVEVIGPAVEAVAGGAGTRSVARGLGVTFAYTTVRGWWRRHRQRVGVLVEVVAGWVSLPRLCAAVADEADGVKALKTVGVSVSAVVG